MCGRFTLRSTPERLRQRFGLATAPDDLVPRYNIAPSQPVLVIPNRTRRLLRPARWGLIPNWAADASVGHRMINARAETLTNRNAFRDAFERRRCLVPADGFYEWKRAGRGRAPFYIHRPDDEPFAFAGLWDVWRPPEGDPIASCTIITTAPNDLVAPLHDRMPVILAPEAYDAWLTPTPLAPDVLLPWLVPCPPEWLEAYPVSSLVSSPANEDAACITPLKPPVSGDPPP
jgi:putative SOS response-associated peptidase YedK